MLRGGVADMNAVLGSEAKPLHEARLAAYHALVITQQCEGLYAMPCAAAVLVCGLLLQTRWVTAGNGQRVNRCHTGLSACDTAKKLVPVSREERAEQGRTGRVLPPALGSAGTRRTTRHLA